jgi:hypothetical protein
MEVLDKRLLETRDIVGHLNKGRDTLQAGSTRGSPAPLAGDELVRAGGDLPQQDRLEHADRADRIHERGERLFIELLPWLVLVGPDARDRDVPEGRRRRLSDR